MKKILMCFAVLAMIISINACNKDEPVPESGVGEMIDLVNNPPDGCHSYTAEELAMIKLRFKERGLLNSEGMLLSEAGIEDAKSYPTGWSEVYCNWLHWGMCCPRGYYACHNCNACPVCGGSVTHLYGCTGGY